jgi:hypothetical protein
VHEKDEMKFFVTLSTFVFIIGFSSKAQYFDIPFKHATSVKFENAAELCGANFLKKSSC